MLMMLFFQPETCLNFADWVKKLTNNNNIFIIGKEKEKRKRDSCKNSLLIIDPVWCVFYDYLMDGFQLLKAGGLSCNFIAGIF